MWDEEVYYQHFHSTFSRGLSAVIMVRERRIEKEDISLLFSDGMVVHVNHLKDYKLLESISEFSKIVGSKMYKSYFFYIPGKNK